MMNADEAKKAKREARIRDMAERLFVAAAPTLFNQVPTDEAGAVLAFEVAEAFERVAEARAKTMRSIEDDIQQVIRFLVGFAIGVWLYELTRRWL